MPTFRRMVSGLQRTFWSEPNPNDKVTGWEAIDGMIKSQRGLAELNSTPREEAVNKQIEAAPDACREVKTAYEDAAQRDNWLDSFEKTRDWFWEAVINGLGSTLPQLNHWRSGKDFEFGAPFVYTKNYERLDGRWEMLGWFLFYFLPIKLVNLIVVFVHAVGFTFSELVLRGLGHVFRLPSDTFVKLMFHEDAFGDEAVDLLRNPGLSILWISLALICSPLWIIGKVCQLAADFVDQLHHLFSVFVVAWWLLFHKINAFLGILQDTDHPDSLRYGEILHPFSWLPILGKTIGISIVLAAAPLLAVFVFLPMLSLAAAILATLATALVLFMGYSIVKAIKRAYWPDEKVRGAEDPSFAGLAGVSSGDLLGGMDLSPSLEPQRQQLPPPPATHIDIVVSGDLEEKRTQTLTLAVTDTPYIYYLVKKGLRGAEESYRTNPSDPLTTVYLVPEQLVNSNNMVQIEIGMSAGEHFGNPPVFYYYCNHPMGNILIPTIGNSSAVMPSQAPATMYDREWFAGLNLVKPNKAEPNSSSTPSVDGTVYRYRAMGRDTDYTITLENGRTAVLYLIPENVLWDEIPANLTRYPMKRKPPAGETSQDTVDGEKISIGEAGAPPVMCHFYVETAALASLWNGRHDRRLQDSAVADSPMHDSKHHQHDGRRSHASSHSLTADRNSAVSPTSNAASHLLALSPALPSATNSAGRRDPHVIRYDRPVGVRRDTGPTTASAEALRRAGGIDALRVSLPADPHPPLLTSMPAVAATPS